MLRINIALPSDERKEASWLISLNNDMYMNIYWHERHWNCNWNLKLLKSALLDLVVLGVSILTSTDS